MGMQKIGNVVAVVGTYEKDGETKNQYARCGVAFKDEDGKVSFKLDTVPTNFSGWFNVYPDEERNTSRPVATPPAGYDEDAPF